MFFCGFRCISRGGRGWQVLLTPRESKAGNWAFDVTPSRLVSGLITERGLCGASEDALLKLFPAVSKG